MGICRPIEDIIAEQHPMMLLHVEQFDGKDVGGTFQFVACHEQRRQAASAASHHCTTGEIACSAGNETVAQHTKQIQVGEFGMKISAAADP